MEEQKWNLNVEKSLEIIKTLILINTFLTGFGLGMIIKLLS